MKNIVTIIGLATFLFLLGACSKKPSEMIVGKWNIVDVKTTSQMDEDMLKEMVAEFKKSGSGIEIKEDKTFTKNNNGEIVNGKWEISEDGKKLTLSYDGSKEDSKINELTETSLSTSITAFDGGENTIIYQKAN